MKSFKLITLWKGKRSNQKLQDDLKIEDDEAKRLTKENDRLRMERNKARLESSGFNFATNKWQLELLQTIIDSIYLEVVTTETSKSQVQKRKPRKRLASSQSSASSSDKN